MLPLNKPQLRKYLRDQRKNFLGKSYANQLIGEKLHKLISENMIFKDLSVGLYYPMGSEVSLLNFAHQHHKKIPFYLPKVNKQGMDFVLWDFKQELSCDILGIPAPNEEAIFIPPIICVPLLGFTQQKHRIGQGAGYYDRFIQQQRSPQSTPPIFVGIAYECQRLDDLPIEAHDEKLDFIVSEEKIYE